MTNEEIWKRQQEHRAHMAAVPFAMKHARDLLADADTDQSIHATKVDVDKLRTLVREVERLQAALKQANQDMRDEQREGQRAAGEAYAEGRHEGLSEGRGW
jgi:hypothetical protein